MAPTSTPTILAVVAEDGRYEAVRRRAEDRARRDRATLLLFDVDAGSSLLESALPTNWSGEGEDKLFGDRLGPEDLEAAGRHPIAEQVRAAREAGVDAWAWLPEHDDADALGSYAASQHATLVVVPDEER